MPLVFSNTIPEIAIVLPSFAGRSIESGWPQAESGRFLPKSAFQAIGDAIVVKVADEESASDGDYRKQALRYSNIIGKHPQSFPDTHGSPPMGMASEALAAHIEAKNFRKLMDANRWWFTMAQCNDGTFYYQPNRDNPGYDSEARMTASSVVAFIFTIPKRNLVLTGKAVP